MKNIIWNWIEQQKIHILNSECLVMHWTVRHTIHARTFHWYVELIKYLCTMKSHRMKLKIQIDTDSMFRRNIGISRYTYWVSALIKAILLETLEIKHVEAISFPWSFFSPHIHIRAARMWFGQTRMPSLVFVFWIYSSPINSP